MDAQSAVPYCAFGVVPSLKWASTCSMYFMRRLVIKALSTIVAQSPCTLRTVGRGVDVSIRICRSAFVRIKSVGLGDLDRESHWREWLPEDESLRHYDASFNLARGKRRVCDHPWHRLVVNWDGQVTPCCHDPNGEYEFGNAAEGIGTVWNGERLRAFRRAIKSQERPMICTKCSAPLWNSPRMGRMEKP
jgi:radical SAM protein with 4Fe4S-binding SPASM domain